MVLLSLGETGILMIVNWLFERLVFCNTCLGYYFLELTQVTRVTFNSYRKTNDHIILKRCSSVVSACTIVLPTLLCIKGKQLSYKKLP